MSPLHLRITNKLLVYKRQRLGALVEDIIVTLLLSLKKKRETIKLKNLLKLSKELVVFVVVTNHKFLLSK